MNENRKLGIVFEKDFNKIIFIMILLQIPDTLPSSSEVIQKSHVWMDKIVNWAIEYAPKVVGSIIIYLLGAFIIRYIVKLSKQIFNKKSFDISLQKFLTSVIHTLLNILLFLTIASVLGVDIMSFVGILAGAGIAIGAALNGSLGNLAGGVMLMIFKPIKVGDIIESQGQLGKVLEIGIFNTILLSPENKTIILPNGGLSTNTITNYNTHGNLRVDLTIGIMLSTDIDKARKVAIDAMLSHPNVLKSPAPEVNVMKVEDGFILLAIRPYTIQENYWDVYFGAQELVKKAFDINNISVPIPTRVVINK